MPVAYAVQDQGFVGLWGVAFGVFKETDCCNEENIDSTWKDFNQLLLTPEGHSVGYIVSCVPFTPCFQLPGFLPGASI